MNEQATIERSIRAALEAYQGERVDEAVELCGGILAIQPDHADAIHLLGLVELSKKHLSDAIELFRRAIDLNPREGQYHASLGLALAESGDYADAIGACHAAIHRDPGFAEAHFNLGIAYRCNNQCEEAIAAYAKSLELRPEFPRALNARGDALRAVGRFEEAVDCYRSVLQLEPRNLEAQNNLGVTLKDLGRVDDAIACLDEAIRSEPECGTLQSNRLYSLYFRGEDDPEGILVEHQRWSERFAAPLMPREFEHANDRDPHRRLRIGYVSPDFREHCQSLFTIPLLSRHDHEQFEIYCYSGAEKSDTVTEEIKRFADGWRETFRVGDEEVVRMICEDGIDLLVDLTQHMGRNRLLVFARKPAPVQVSWLGYPGTTGLTAIDYRFTDPYLDPPGVGDGLYSERSVRLPETFWCYDPRADVPVNALPADAMGHITFGCLNNFCKVNDRTLMLWSRVLHAVPDSRLMLLAPRGVTRLHVLENLRIDADRIEFVDFQPRGEYLKRYHAIDLCLDTFPYNGHTTSLDALWMGVPVVSLFGRSAVSRAGFSQSFNLGLSHLAVDNADEFAGRAIALAEDREELRKLRSTLRDRMIASPLMDAPRFARNVEGAYRALWRNWCRNSSPWGARIEGVV